MRKKANKVKTIFNPTTRDTRINHQSSFSTILHAGTITKKMKNEANFTQNFSLPLLQKDAKKRALFLRNTQKSRTFTNFYTRFLQTFSCFVVPIPPKPHNFNQKLRNTKQNKPKTKPISNENLSRRTGTHLLIHSEIYPPRANPLMQNKPNPPQPGSQGTREKNAKQTQFNKQ